VPSSFLWPAIRISALYALFAGLWIVFSDQAVALLVPDPQTHALVQTYKGAFFVCVTAGLLFVLLHGELRVREEDRARLRALLREQDVLFSELHHRVKNNMQTAVGLVELQAAQFADPQDRARLADCARRIRALGLVHDALGRERGSGRIDMGHYLDSLGRELLGAYDGQRRNIALHVDGGGVVLGLDRATFLALALAELLTNAFKHAFPPGRSGTVRVALRADGDWLEAEVADDGVGLPTDMNPDTAQSMGMTILGGLTAQLRGSLEFLPGSGPGTRAVLRVPLAEPGGAPAARAT